jgi:excisionase family DNA binding protein
MAKKLTFDKLPEAVARILEILSSEGSEQTLLPELLARMTRLEKKVEHLQLLVSPDKPVLDMQAVCKVLKLRPKAVSDLADRGALPSRTHGGKTVFYEEGVLKYFATQPAWTAAVAADTPATATRPSAIEPSVDEPIFEGPAKALVSAEGRQRVDINVASRILGRSVGAVYQLTSNNKVPFHKDGSKVYFHTDELQEWALITTRHARAKVIVRPYLDKVNRLFSSNRQKNNVRHMLHSGNFLTRHSLLHRVIAGFDYDRMVSHTLRE